MKDATVHDAEQGGREIQAASLDMAGSFASVFS